MRKLLVRSADQEAEQSAAMSKRRIAVDFDGVIHAYTKGWQDGSIYDEPVEGAIEALLKLSERFEVYIFTTRVKDLEQADMIRQWLIKHGWPHVEKPFPEITNIKQPATAYIDDRAIRFTNWADVRKYFD